MSPAAARALGFLHADRAETALAAAQRLIPLGERTARVENGCSNVRRIALGFGFGRRRSGFVAVAESADGPFGHRARRVEFGTRASPRPGPMADWAWGSRSRPRRDGLDGACASTQPATAIHPGRRSQTDSARRARVVSRKPGRRNPSHSADLAGRSKFGRWRLGTVHHRCRGRGLPVRPREGTPMDAV